VVKRVAAPESAAEAGSAVNPIDGKSFFCSWSGGKDSCLALYHAVQAADAAKRLFTMLTEDMDRSRSHALPVSVLEAQAAALGVPLAVRGATWDDYEDVFIAAIRELRTDGAEWGVFGDIDLDAHLEWVERVCGLAQVRVFEPLWQRPRRELLEEFLDLGFKATIISVKESVLDPALLGSTLDWDVIGRIEGAGADASGETGEYHTVVTDGPIFSAPVRLVAGDLVRRSGYCFLEVGL